MIIRRYQESDRELLYAITAVCFEGVSIDYNIEARYGLIAEKDWQWCKLRHIEADIAANPTGIFVAEEANTVIGYITTRVDADSKIGWIPNLGVLPAHRQQGVGRQLMDTALAYFVTEGMLYARIETLAHNVIGQHFYPGAGFEEVAQQIHYIMPLEMKDEGATK
ncbi:MAG: GNAT family N-acetyltransferase [Anaerolineae bacterium]|nr:GNAT family N-acetyltransferase [Anaerolineae bacterium]